MIKPGTSLASYPLTIESVIFPATAPESDRTGGDATMGINFDRALKLHAEALELRSRRTEIVAANLANADTPGYMARDFDFKTAMAEAFGAEQPLKVTHAHHLQAPRNNPDELLYRMPSQMSLDGNTVETEQEKAVFADNALRYQASLRFMGNRVQGLMTAIKGE